ncbi:MAG TPA: GDSL-type esterase/lipase family protein [Acidimicrobiales bacterium]|nr:GDSL-type esterase/lipase family protein [Acidimicrobiales bacterium]
MRYRARYVAAMVVVVALVVGVFLVQRSVTAPRASAAAGSSFSAFYLDVGASTSLGFQPTGIVHHNGRRTNTGYANDLLEVEKIKGVSLTLVQLGCPGETVQTILGPTPINKCYKAPETQMTQAVAFLKAHQGVAGLVTIDLGFNNIRNCVAVMPVNEACANTAIAAVQVDMPKVVRELKAAAGPRVRFVGLEFEDPFLADYLRGSTGPSNATASLAAVSRLNAVLAQAFGRNGVAVANVPAIFQSTNTTPVTLTNVGVIPENVYQACQLTWQCYGLPFGPDDHPNDAGYALIAQAIAAVLPKSW